MSQLIISEGEKRKITTLVKNNNFILSEDVTKKLYNLWESFTMAEKLFIIEFLIETQQDKVKVLKESKWYNTLGDIIGIFDPTGVVDIMNGISYWRQGDKLYAILSWISAVPLLGDTIAKPVIGVMKVGSASSKSFKAAVEAGNAAKIAEAASKAGGAVKNMVTSVSTWGDKLVDVLKRSVGRIPIGLPFLAGGATLSGKGFVNVVGDWVNTFKTASNTLEAGGKFRPFSSYKSVSPSKFENMISGGFFTLFGANPALKFQLTKTKSYLDFLDYLGIGNFVGPDELKSRVPNVEQEFQNYAKTPEGRQSLENDAEILSDEIPPGLTKDEYYKIIGKEDKKTNYLDIAKRAVGNKIFSSGENPIYSLFSTLIK